MTPRVLSVMALARREHDWGQTSHLLAYIHNAGFGAKEAISADELNPFRQSLSIGLDDRAVVLPKLDFWKAVLRHQVQIG